MLVFPDVKRRYSNFGEFKIICAINAAFLRARIGNGAATLCLCPFCHDIVQRRHAETRIFYVARFSPHIHAIDVDVGQRFLQWVERMERVILGAEQARFLRGGSDKKERALGRRIHLRKGAPQRDERRYTRCVVNRAVKNLIAG